MRTSKLLATCALGTSLMVAGAAFAPAYAETAPATKATATTQSDTTAARHTKHERYAEKMKAVDTSNWLSIKAVHDKVEAAGYKDIGNITRTPKGYMVGANNAEGQWTRLSVEPVKGEITPLQHKSKSERKHRHAKNS